MFINTGWQKINDNLITGSVQITGTIQLSGSCLDPIPTLTVSGNTNIGISGTVLSCYSHINGGFGNRILALSPSSSILGGGFNTIHNSSSVICGGSGNVANGESSFIGGGLYNSASAFNTVVVGGYNNIASAKYTSIGGGANNTAINGFATVCGGIFNRADGGYSFVGGGQNCTIGASAGNWNVICGGYSNRIQNPAQVFLGGGAGNRIFDLSHLSVLVGGNRNTMANSSSVICGGSGNVCNGELSFIGGGQFNTASAFSSVVIGGVYNTASGIGSMILGSGQYVTGNAVIAIGGRVPNIAAEYQVGINAYDAKTAVDFRYSGSSCPTIALGANQGAGIETVYYGTNASMTAGKLYYLNSGSVWREANASISESGSCHLLGIAKGTDVSLHGILLDGYFKITTYFSGTWAPGMPLYMSTGAGYVTSMRPSGSSQAVRVIGSMTTVANVMRLKVSPDWLIV